jgi:hypothetical protein
MDFSFFEKLSKKEANFYLTRFLSEESEGFSELQSILEKELVPNDFSMESIAPIFNWVKLNLSIVPEEGRKITNLDKGI